MEIRSITASQARAVRLPVLRPGLQPHSAVLERDDDPGTVHLGAFEGDRLLGVATFFAQECPVRPGIRAWRLRGMATLPEAQRRGAGRALVEHGAILARADGGRALWCNARVTARGFYEKLGFAAEGETFDLPGTGRHYLMIKVLSAATRTTA